MAAKRNEISAETPNVIRRQLPLIIGGVLMSQILYTLLFRLYRDDPDWFGLPMPSAEYCEGQLKCGRADLFAFQVVSGLSFIPIAGIAIYSWHISRRAFRLVPNTPEGRIYGYVPECEYMTALNLVYQIWDFLYVNEVKGFCCILIVSRDSFFLGYRVQFQSFERTL